MDENKVTGRQMIPLICEDIIAVFIKGNYVIIVPVPLAVLTTLVVRNPLSSTVSKIVKGIAIIFRFNLRHLPPFAQKNAHFLQLQDPVLEKTLFQEGYH